MNYWLLFEKSDETRVSKGIDGYKDATGESYCYDSLVPNHLKVAKGDFIVLRKENEIVGIGAIGDIAEKEDVKLHRRCPSCGSTDIRERSTLLPKWKCGKCAEEFSEPNETITAVRSYVAEINEFVKLNAPPSVTAVKMCAAGGSGVGSQLSMLCLDPKKVRNLLEGLDAAPSSRMPVAETGGQGFGLSQVERRAVDLRAMQLARRLYEEAGWEVTDMSSSRPFDLLATKESQQRYIKVKGTAGDGCSVMLTHSEVSHIQSNSECSALLVVSGITLEKDDGGWDARGGSITTHEHPWMLLEESLAPTQYRYKIK